MSKTIEYPFTVRPLSKEDGGGFLCEFPDLPGVMGDGGSVEEAIADGRKALKAALATLRQMGRKAPEPTRASGQCWLHAPSRRASASIRSPSRCWPKALGGATKPRHKPPVMDKRRKARHRPPPKLERAQP